MSLSDLASKVGVSRNAASYWEMEADKDNASRPTLENIDKIVDAFELTLPMFWSDPPKGKKGAA